MMLKIEEFRKRRPRLIDEVITLAHGAGGKSSAALTDNVFVEAFRNPELEQLGDGAVLTLPCTSGSPSRTDSFVVQPIEFPGGTIGHLAVHGTVNDLAVSGRQPAVALGGVRDRGGIHDRPAEAIVADMRQPPSRRRTDRHRRHEGGRPGARPTGCTSRRPASGVIPAGRDLGADLVRPGDRWSSPGPSVTTAWP